MCACATPFPFGRSKMADKLSDNDIANELKRFGEIIKLPIDKKKRPILIKKLNHYYAKENPPPKKGKTFQRPPRKSRAVAEFSDDSQDENESKSEISSITLRGNKTRNNSILRDSPRKRTPISTVRNGTDSPGFNARNVQNKRVSNVVQMEVFPDEFSDNDTADESVYVEEKSIGINTSMAYDEEEDDDDDDDETNDGIVTHANMNRHNIGNNLSTISPSSTPRNSSTFKRKPYLSEESGQFVSKTILYSLAVFFVLLGISYLYVRKDMFLSSEAAVLNKGKKCSLLNKLSQTSVF